MRSLRSIAAHLLALAAMPRMTTRTDRPTQFPGIRIRANWPCPCGSGKKFKHCHKVQGKFYTIQRPEIPAVQQGSAHGQEGSTARQ